LQERYRTDPWRLLVTCAMLNLTSRVQVRPLIDAIFSAYPTPAAMAEAGPELEELIRPCGLAEQRARRLRLMAADFLRAEVLSPGHVQRLHACGRYAADSFQIFCQGDLDTRPADRVLAAYVEQRRAAE
jgi:endonuclease III